MKEPVFYTGGHTAALRFAETVLKKKDFPFAIVPDTSVTHLLLDVPSFESDGRLKGGRDLDEVLSLLSPNVTVCGGMLHHPKLAKYRTVDLLEDHEYVAQNAQITAYCAVKLAMQQLPVILWHCPVLVVGWGRIGKCLAQLLKNMGALVTVAARKETDRAILAATGYNTADTQNLANGLARFRLIFNTAPALILPRDALQDRAADCLMIDLASSAGIDAPDVHWARGLPGKDAPETSGELIAKTILRLL